MRLLRGLLGDHLSMLSFDHQVSLLGMGRNSRLTCEVVAVVMGELLRIGGYGVAVVWKLLMGISYMCTPTGYCNGKVVWHGSAERATLFVLSISSQWQGVSC